MERLRAAKIVPVIVIEDVADAVPLAEALRAGGLAVAEITFRTGAAAGAIRAIVREFPEFIVGAGTVTRAEELEAAREAGAMFGVAPGFNARIVARAAEAGWAFVPGVATASEVEAALEAGVEVLKFFPAAQLGGPAMLAALAGVYGHRGVKFMPAGGVNAGNFREYLGTKGVVAVGGSWMATAEMIRGKQWARVTELTRAATNC